MNIKIRSAQTMNEIGQKDNQEDCLYPYSAALSEKGLPTKIRCFVLCDGMGGHENGEIAAGIVSSTLQPAMVDTAGTPDIMTVDRFEKALKKTYTELDKMEVEHGKRPGTTMTCVYFAENGVFVAHIGDSRVYQVRPGKGIVFRTSDHSLVNELVKAGEITEEEAAHHPRRNVILRAMQPGLEVPYKADTTLLTDVRPGDYFFMCSDGILENISDQMLVDILSKNISDSEKNVEIFNICNGRTRDNFSSILIPVDSVDGEPLAIPEPAEQIHHVDIDDQTITADVVNVSARQTQKVPDKQNIVSANKSFFDKNKQWIITGVAVVIAVIVTVFICMSVMGDKTEKSNNDGVVDKTDKLKDKEKDESKIKEIVEQNVTTPADELDNHEQSETDRDGISEKLRGTVEEAEARATDPRATATSASPNPLVDANKNNQAADIEQDNRNRQSQKQKALSKVNKK